MSGSLKKREKRGEKRKFIPFHLILVCIYKYFNTEMEAEIFLQLVKWNKIWEIKKERCTGNERKRILINEAKKKNNLSVKIAILCVFLSRFGIIDLSQQNEKRKFSSEKKKNIQG